MEDLTCVNLIEGQYWEPRKEYQFRFYTDKLDDTEIDEENRLPVETVICFSENALGQLIKWAGQNGNSNSNSK